MPPESSSPARAVDVVDTATATVRSWIAAPEPADDAPRRRSPLSERRLFGAHRRAAVVADPAGREFVAQFIDLVIGTRDAGAAARHLERLSRDLPTVLPLALRIVIQLAGGFAVLLPRVVMPAVRAAFRWEVADRVLDAEPKRLGAAIARLRDRGIRPSLAPFGEAVHGTAAADRRMAAVRQLLARDDVHDVSVRLTEIAGPPQPWAHDEAVEQAIDRVLPLYELAAGSATTKRLVLEMEEYRHFDLTLDVFMGLLSRPSLLDYEGGITLQAYLPDSAAALSRITEWASERRARGGAGVVIRLVKGGHLPLERERAEQQRVAPATFPERQQTDAAYIRLLDWIITPERTDAVHVGVATHNLFDIAFAWHLAQERGVASRVTVEMLRGVSPHAGAVNRHVGDLVLYSPVVDDSDIGSVASHLLQRLDDGADAESFQSVAGRLGEERDLFEAAVRRFREAVAASSDSGPANARMRARTIGEERPALTDPAVPSGREWARTVLDRARASQAGRATVTASMVGDLNALEVVASASAAAGEAWASRDAAERATGIRDLAAVLDALRGTIIETLVSETGATFAEADADAAHAVAAAHTVARAASQLGPVENAEIVPVPVVLVAPAWSTALVDSVEAIASALAAGSAALVQPPHQARRSCAIVIEAAREAGLPESLVTLVVPEDAAVAKATLAHPGVDRVAFTGDREAATLLRSWRAARPPLGDVQGVASVVVTESADIDTAVDDIVRGAFTRGGQHPGGGRLVIVVGEAGRSQAFRVRLADAVRSTRPAPAVEALSRMGPLITTPPERQRRLLATLEGDESWLVEPEALDDRRTLWRPGVRDGVDPDVAVRRTAPVPAIVLTQVADLDAAIDLQRSARGGVAAIHTHDVDELAAWLDASDTGTLVVNGATAGSGLDPLPAGGWRGAGGLRGSSERILALADWVPVFAEPQQSVRLDGIGDQVRALIEAAQPTMQFLEFDLVRAGATSDERAWVEHYRDPVDLSVQQGMRTVTRHLPVETTIRLADGVSSAQLVRVLAAATRAGAPVHVSTAAPLAERLVQFFAHPLSPLRVRSVLVEGDARWHTRVQSGEVATPHIRLIGGDPEVLAAVLAIRPDVALHAAPVTTSGRLELLPFLRAQVVHMTARRHGRPDPVVAQIEF